MEIKQYTLWTTKMMHPDSIDDDAGGKRIIGICDGVSKLLSSTAIVIKRWVFPLYNSEKSPWRFGAAFANERLYSTEPISEIPAAPSLEIPKIKAKPASSQERKEEGDVEQLPSAPVFHSEGIRDNGLDFDEATPYFWPWHQEDEWTTPEIIKQLQAAIRSAKEQNIAQATVLLDEVGPHLGNRTSLIYSVGRLLMSIGRDREARRMVESANDAFPDNADVQRAMEKLIS